MAELVLGYDLRWSPARLAPLWDANRRMCFLLRPDALPRSVDLLVWPSRFDYGIGCGLPEEERHRIGLAGARPPDWTGPNVGLWEDREALLAAQPIPSPALVLVAVTWHRPEPPAEPGPVGPYGDLAAALPPAPEWRLLGYDVADGSLLSVLSNCGYTDAERASMQADWGPALNEHHLFRETSTAEHFRAVGAVRVPEHAPCFVFGLYTVEG